MNRRDFIVSGAIGTGIGIYGGWQMAQKENCSVGEYSIGEEAVEIYSDEILGSDIIIEQVAVEGYSLEEEYLQEVEELFSENNLDLTWVEHPETVTEEQFFDNYSPTVEEILGEQDSLHSHISDDTNEEFIQAYFVPGKKNGRPTVKSGENEVWGKAGPGDELYTSRFLVAPIEQVYSQEKKKWLTAHELGHTLGLNHTEKDTIMNNSIVNKERTFNYSKEHWQEIKNNTA